MVRLRLTCTDIATPLPAIQAIDPTDAAALAAAMEAERANAFQIPDDWVDCEGNKLKYFPPRFHGDPEEWYRQLHKLRPGQCGWPDGKSLVYRGDQICKRPKSPASNRCARHLGARGRGMVKIAAGEKTATTGFSDYLPPDYWQMYQRVKADPNLLHIRQDVELVAIRQSELVKQLHSGESGSLWKELKEAWAAVKAASAAGNAEMLKAAMQNVGRVIADGNAKEKLWKEIMNTTDRVVTLKRAEHQRLKELHEMLTIERFLVMLAGYHEIVLEMTPERERRVRIAARLQQIIESGMNTPAAGRCLPAGGGNEGGECGEVGGDDGGEIDECDPDGDCGDDCDCDCDDDDGGVPYMDGEQTEELPDGDE